MKNISQFSNTISGGIFVDWYKNVFIPSIKEHKPGKDEKFLLILDNAPCHLSAEVLNEIDPQVKVFYLPPDISAIQQPMNQGVIECMKHIYKKLFLRKLVLFDEEWQDAIQTFIKKWNLLDTSSTVATAWSLVPSSVLSKAWQKFLGYPTFPSDHGAETMDIVNIVNNAHGSNVFTATEAAEWVNEDQDLSTWRELTDKELLDQVPKIYFLIIKY